MKNFLNMFDLKNFNSYKNSKKRISIYNGLNKQWAVIKSSRGWYVATIWFTKTRFKTKKWAIAYIIAKTKRKKYWQKKVKL